MPLAPARCVDNKIYWLSVLICFLTVCSVVARVQIIPSESRVVTAGNLFCDEIWLELFARTRVSQVSHV